MLDSSIINASQIVFIDDYVLLWEVAFTQNAAILHRLPLVLCYSVNL